MTCPIGRSSHARERRQVAAVGVDSLGRARVRRAERGSLRRQDPLADVPRRPAPRPTRALESRSHGQTNLTPTVKERAGAPARVPREAAYPEPGLTTQRQARQIEGELGRRHDGASFRRRGCRAASSRASCGRAVPAPCAGRRRPRSGGLRMHAGDDGGARRSAGASRCRAACRGPTGRRRSRRRSARDGLASCR